MKKILVTVILFCLSKNISFAAEPQILIINQIRGSEVCCESGTTDMIVSMNKDKAFTNIPVAWALRFDALNDSYKPLFREGDNMGLLLEVTPSLANASGVKYKGAKNGSDWYSAKNALLIGYEVEERKKILDTTFEKYRDLFGTYPRYTVSWMIDAWSLNYIHDTFGVKLHEITKEQYETDSYTLYGGIFNKPYYPSKNHPLIPGFGEDKIDMLVVRQTISDPVKNYGSQKTYFTSQPNDYLSNPKNPKNYFESLVNQAITQKSDGFGLLGLENSFPWKDYEKEYKKQIQYIKNLEEKKKLNIENVNNFIDAYPKENNPSFIKTSKSLWYFGKRYRARVIEKKGNLIIDDIRVYSPSISDPYKERGVKSDYAYWIIPYAIDGSQMFEMTDIQKKEAQNEELFSDKTVPDIFTNPFGINLGKGKLDEAIEKLFTEDKIIVPKDRNPSFTNSENLSFENIINQKKEKIIQFVKHPDFFIKPHENNINIGWRQKEETLTLLEIIKTNENYEIKPGLDDEENIENFNMIFSPDIQTLPYDTKKTIIYWNNTIAIEGRNPVRVFILPLNRYGRPTAIKKVKIVERTGVVESVYPEDFAYKITPWFIDLTSKKAGIYEIQIKLDGKTLQDRTRVIYTPDCQKKPTDCILNPNKMMWYSRAMFDEKTREFTEFLKTKTPRLLEGFEFQIN